MRKSISHNLIRLLSKVIRNSLEFRLYPHELRKIKDLLREQIHRATVGADVSNERFVRWQGNTMAQLSTALSLLSGLSVAGLGFLFSLLREKDFLPTACYALLFLIALGAFFVASAAGVGAVITRLIDFRLTAQKVRQKEIEEPLTFFGTDASGYGKATWRLFWVLVTSFSIAVLLASVVIAHVYLKDVINAAGFNPALKRDAAEARRSLAPRYVS